MTLTPKQRLMGMDALWLGLLTLYILAGAAIVPFHGDESTQIFMGRDYYYHFVEADLSKIVYDASGSASLTEQELRLLNGTIAKTIYGWITASSGLRLDELNEQWDWEADYTYNRDTHRIPNDHLLHKGRLASALQLALAVWVFFGFVRLTMGRPTAWLASALFALHPSILLNGRRAMTEGSHLLGMMLVLLAAAWLMRRRPWWGYMALGCAIGLAVAAKHPNVFAAALVFFACFSCDLAQAMRKQRGTARVWGRLLMTALTALLVFYALNPGWWLAPLSTARTALRIRANLLRNQTATFGGYASAAERADGFFRYVFAGEVQYFEDPAWAGYDVIRVQIETYQGSGLAGLGADGSRLGGWLFLPLAIGGSLHFVRNKRIRREYRWLLLVWGLGMMTLTFILTPLPWARYYLPALPFAASMAAYGLLTLAARIWKQIKTPGYGFTVLD